MGTVIKELVQRGHDMAADLNSSCGAVDVRSVAKLISDLASQLDVQLARGNQIQQQLAEVVAENAGLKQANSIALKILNDDETMVTSLWASSIQKVEMKTPATDAAIANIQAQGVEMYAVTLDRGADDAERDGFEDGMKFLRAEAESVREFAAQLRQGAAL